MAINQTAESLAVAMIRKHNILGPAVPVKDIIKAEGLDVIPYNLGDGVSGTLVIENDKGYIGYNPSESKQRQRFTIAHELGHFLMHTHKQNSRKIFIDSSFIVKYRSAKNYSEFEWREEQEANAFAAALLMPEAFILEELAKASTQKLDEIELIDFFAKKFEVSVPAMTFRFNKINGSF